MYIDMKNEGYYNLNLVIHWQVIWENKEGVRDELPTLIYVSRGKNPQIPHHYKAGAMNVLVIMFFSTSSYIS